MTVEAFDAEGDRLGASTRDLVVEAGAVTPVKLRLSVDETPSPESPEATPSPEPTSYPEVPRRGRARDLLVLTGTRAREGGVHPWDSRLEATLVDRVP